MNSAEKISVSTKTLTRAQLLIYYPIAIYTGWIYNPPRYVNNMMEHLFLRITGLQLDGISIFNFTAIILSNALSVTLVFKVIFRPSKYIYEGKNGWHSIWWNLGVQLILYVFFIFLLVRIFGFGDVVVIKKGFLEFLKEIFSTFSLDAIVFFLGTVGTYSFLQLINKIISFRRK